MKSLKRATTMAIRITCLATRPCASPETPWCLRACRRTRRWCRTASFRGYSPTANGDSRPWLTASRMKRDRDRRLRRQRLRQLGGLGHQLGGRHDAIDQANLVRAVRADHVARRAGSPWRCPCPPGAAAAGCRHTPACRPRLISGWPNRAVSAAIRMVQAIASSQPPPSAKPLIAAITGLPSLFDGIEDQLAAPRVRLAFDRRQRRQFVDVGAGDERLLARPGEDDRAHAVVGLEGRPCTRPVRPASDC